MIYICKIVRTRDWNIYYHIFVVYKMYLQMTFLANIKINRALKSSLTKWSATRQNSKGVEMDHQVVRVQTQSGVRCLSIKWFTNQVSKARSFIINPKLEQKWKGEWQGSKIDAGVWKHVWDVCWGCKGLETKVKTREHIKKVESD